MNLDALIFVPALVGSTIIGFVFLLCASNYFLTVLEGTAAGAKEIPWQSEAITDHFPKVFYLAWLIGLWCGPAYFVGRALASGADPGWLRLAVPLLVMWALYPVSQLSSLSASSVWVPLTPDVFARLSQKPLVTAGFYALSLPVVVLLGVAFKWAFMTKGEWHLLFAGSPLLALAALLWWLDPKTIGSALLAFSWQPIAAASLLLFAGAALALGALVFSRVDDRIASEA